MIFETDRLTLRPWQESDAANLYEYAKDPRVGPCAGWPVHTSVENSLEVIRYVLSQPETYAVCLKENGQAIGSIGIFQPTHTNQPTEPDELEIGYWIGVPFWGQGLIPEAVRRLQQYAFDTLNCPALWCAYYEGNEKSLRVQEKCGFLPHHIEENKPVLGELRTEHYMRLSRKRWETLQAKSLTDITEIKSYIKNGKLTQLPSKRRKKLIALCWLADRIPEELCCSERGFNIFLNTLHTFGDPATLRRELYDFFLIDRDLNCTNYRVNPDRLSAEELIAKYC